MLDVGTMRRFLQMEASLRNEDNTGQTWQADVAECIGAFMNKYAPPVVESARDPIMNHVLNQLNGIYRTPYVVTDLLVSTDELLTSDSGCRRAYDDLVGMMAGCCAVRGIEGDVHILPGLIPEKPCNFVLYGMRGLPASFMLAYATYPYRGDYIRFVTFGTESAARLMQVLIDQLHVNSRQILWDTLWHDVFNHLAELDEHSTRDVCAKWVKVENVDMSFWGAIVRVWYPEAIEIDTGKLRNTMRPAIAAQLGKSAANCDLDNLVGVWVIGTRHWWCARMHENENTYACGFVTDKEGNQQARDEAVAIGL